MAENIKAPLGANRTLLSEDEAGAFLQSYAGTAMCYSHESDISENGSEFKSQPIFDKNTNCYKRIWLKDGTSHWVITWTDSAEYPLLVMLAVDPRNGLFYSCMVSTNEIARIEILPEQIVESLPHEKRPFGFADREPAHTACECVATGAKS